jgi:sucrose-6-phosphate hydrolase SacC (GH32 family)
MFNSRCYVPSLLIANGLISVLLITFVVAASKAEDLTTASTAKAAPKPLYRDPVHDGAADPSLIWNRAEKKWMMFYTNRRADLSSSDPKDVAWVHGTQIGIAESKDGGTTWTYAGTAKIPYGKPDYTFWAPDLVWDHGLYHMFVVVVPGTFHDWNAPREIIHLTSKDLAIWKFESKLTLSSNRTIDPYIFKLDDGSWRLWYKDEEDHSAIHYVNSPDLYQWTGGDVAIDDRPCEGPTVFRWKGSIWMIVDPWSGLGVYKSFDALHWTPQKENILAGAGDLPTDRSKGHHADVAISKGRAFLYYFVQQEGQDEVSNKPKSANRSVLQVVELTEEDGQLKADRNRPTFVSLDPAGDRYR